MIQLLMLIAQTAVCPSPELKTVPTRDTALFVYEDRVNKLSIRTHGDTLWLVNTVRATRVIDNGHQIFIRTVSQSDSTDTDWCVRGADAVRASGVHKGKVVPVSSLRQLQKVADEARHASRYSVIPPK